MKKFLILTLLLSAPAAFAESVRLEMVMRIQACYEDGYCGTDSWPLETIEVTADPSGAWNKTYKFGGTGFSAKVSAQKPSWGGYEIAVELASLADGTRATLETSVSTVSELNHMTLKSTPLTFELDDGRKVTLLPMLNFGPAKN